MSPDEKNALLDAYSEWLANERLLLHAERYGGRYPETMRFIPATPAGDFHFPWRDRGLADVPAPSARAEQVLRYVGAQWRRPQMVEAPEDAILELDPRTFNPNAGGQS